VVSSTDPRFSRAEPLLFLSSSSSIVLTRLSGPRSKEVSLFRNLLKTNIYEFHIEYYLQMEMLNDIRRSNTLLQYQWMPYIPSDDRKKWNWKRIMSWLPVIGVVETSLYKTAQNCIHSCSFNLRAREI
jgi:hypothetical protein